MSVNSKSSGTPVTITQSLSDLRLTHARLLEEHGATAALLRQSEAQLDKYEQREVELQNTISSLQQELRTAMTQVTRREARAALAERETGFLQALLASFNSEANLDMGSAERIDRTKAMKVEQLEHLLSEYKTANEQLQKEVDGLGGSWITGNGRSRQELSEEVDKALAEKFALQKGMSTVQFCILHHTHIRLDLDDANSEMKLHLDKVEELEQTLFELQGEIAGGRHVPPGVRILSLKDNPEQQWFDLRQAALQRLKNENEALMKRLKDLEDSGVRPQDQAQVGGELVPRESWELVNKEKQDLEELIKQKEKRLLRLQQVLPHPSICLSSKLTMLSCKRSSPQKAPNLEKPLHRFWV